MSPLNRRLVLLALLGALTGCGVGTEPPAGLRRYKGDLFLLDHPSAWEVREVRSAGRPTVEFNGPARSDGTRDAEVRVTDWGAWNTTLSAKVVQFRGAAPRAGYTIEKEEPVMVAGAESAHRFTLSRRIRTVTGARVRMVTVETFVLTGDRRLLDFVVRSPKDTAERKRLDAVLGSFAVREKNGWFGMARG